VQFCYKDIRKNDRSRAGEATAVFTRRGFVNGALGVGATLALAPRDSQAAAARTGVSQIEHNKAVVRRFMESQGAKNEDAVMREILAPNFRWSRLATEHLNNHARDQGLPGAGPDLRSAFPDHAYLLEEHFGEGDMVGLKFCSSGTQQAAFNGIPATGRKFDIQNVSMFRLADGKIADAWILNDEFHMLLGLGVKLTAGKDGPLTAPPMTGAGEDPDVVIRRLEAGPLASQEDRNRLLIARTKGSAPFPKENYAPDFRQTRFGFKHLRNYGAKTGTASQNLGTALSERRDRIENLIAEGDRVWMRFKVVGVHSNPLHGLPPTGKRVEVAEIAMMRVVDGKWKDAWYFADELGLMLQLGIVNAVLS
jgi:predicted ester cyclase